MSDRTERFWPVHMRSDDDSRLSTYSGRSNSFVGEEMEAITKRYKHYYNWFCCDEDRRRVRLYSVSMQSKVHLVDCCSRWCWTH